MGCRILKHSMDETITRTEKMAELYRSGKTLQQIGDMYSVSRERVRQILAPLGFSRESGGSYVRSERILTQVRSFHDQGCNLEQIAEKTGISSHSARHYLQSQGISYRIRAVPPECLAELKELYDKGYSFQSLADLLTEKTGRKHFPQTVERSLKTHPGFESRPRYLKTVRTPAFCKLVVKGYKTGKSIVALAEELNSNQVTVRKVLEEHKVPVRRGGRWT